MFKFRVSSGTLTAAVFAVLSSFTAAEAGPVAGRYQVTMAGFSIGVATFDGMISSQSYQATLNAQLTGLAGVLSSGRGVVRVSGSFQGDRPISTGYALAAHNSQISRTIQIGMSGGHVGEVNIEPPFEPKADRVPLLEHHRRSVIDPVSALMMPVSGNAELLSPESCNRALPVFDGVQRFTIQLSYKEMRVLTEPKKGYVGHALVCNARYVPVAGHRPVPSTTYMAENRSMNVWLVPVAGSQTLVPWRIEVQTQIGKLNIEAQSISGLAQDATASIRR